MKKLILAISAALALTACSQQQASRSIVVYYSQTGATQEVASLLVALTGADSLRIEAAEPYNGDFSATIERCLKEREEGALPSLMPLACSLSDYDTIYLGYPIWFGTCAPPMLSLLADADLSGKVVVPFCTFGSGGLETSMADVRAAQPEATVLDGFGIRNARLGYAEGELSDYLIRLGVMEGEAAPLPQYGEQEPLEPAEQALFDMATAGYPMPLGQAVSVASAGDDVHYCFAAEGVGPDGQSARSLVYIVRTDSGAEFTRVQR